VKDTKSLKPKTGDVVLLRTVSDAILGSNSKKLCGIVTGCYGIRCRVYWVNNVKLGFAGEFQVRSLMERHLLEVISESR